MEKNRNPALSSTERGARAEARARAFLETRGFTFVEANFRFRGGEIDLVLIAPLSGELVFVEVRSAAASSPWLRYTITPRKGARLWKTAESYLLRRPWARGRGVRFDVVWLEGARVEHWPNVAVRATV